MTREQFWKKLWTGYTDEEGLSEKECDGRLEACREIMNLYDYLDGHAPPGKKDASANLAGKFLTRLPPILDELPLMKYGLGRDGIDLDLSDNRFSSIPTVRNARAMDVSGNPLNGSVSEDRKMPFLIKLRALRAELSHFPFEKNDLPNLTSLDISGNCFTGIPRVVMELPKLEVLYASRNLLLSLPHIGRLGNLSRLRELDISHNLLEKVPSVLSWRGSPGGADRQSPLHLDITDQQQRWLSTQIALVRNLRDAPAQDRAKMFQDAWSGLQADLAFEPDKAHHVARENERARAFRETFPKDVYEHLKNEGAEYRVCLNDTLTDVVVYPGKDKLGAIEIPQESASPVYYWLMNNWKYGEETKMYSLPLTIDDDTLVFQERFRSRAVFDSLQKGAQDYLAEAKRNVLNNPFNAAENYGVALSWLSQCKHMQGDIPPAKNELRDIIPLTESINGMLDMQITEHPLVVKREGAVVDPMSENGDARIVVEFLQKNQKKMTLPQPEKGGYYVVRREVTDDSWQVASYDSHGNSLCVERTACFDEDAKVRGAATRLQDGNLFGRLAAEFPDVVSDGISFFLVKRTNGGLGSGVHTALPCDAEGSSLYERRDAKTIPASLDEAINRRRDADLVQPLETRRMHYARKAAGYLFPDWPVIETRGRTRTAFSAEEKKALGKLFTYMKNRDPESDHARACNRAVAALRERSSSPSSSRHR